MFERRRHYTALVPKIHEMPRRLARKMIRRPGKLWKMASFTPEDEDPYIKGGGGVGEL